MKISYNWLKTIIQSKALSPEQVSIALTDCGLEVESMDAFESVKGMLKGVVVGQVLEKEKHPNADKLSLTKVDIGNDTILQIVCGAPNVAAHQKVLVSTVGSVLHTFTGETIEIKKSKIRGELSEGMICAEDELGLGNAHDGIMILPEDAQIGTSAAEYLQLYTDTVFEIGLTPNRGDAASHLGVARDLAAVLNCQTQTEVCKVQLPDSPILPEASGILSIGVKIEDQQACKRYSGITISGIKVAPSPSWLKNYIQAIGLRSINNIVDITNFVMHECGQPMHAFDAFAIQGKEVLVRSARSGEKFITLDGLERNLQEKDLVIANKEEAMCIAGVFGGLKSGVNEQTSAVFLEAAYFDPSSVRKTAKRLGLKTDSSFRFERGTDPEMTLYAINRATNLILEIAGGQISSPLVDIYPVKIQPFKVAFSYSNCDRLIGKTIDRNTIKTILRALGIDIIQEGSDGLLLHVPRYKYDVTREVDVIEEILRIYGMNQVEWSGKISFSMSQMQVASSHKTDADIASLLVDLGFCEAMSTSLTKAAYTQDTDGVVPMLNPLSSDLSVLRPSLLFGLLEAVAFNINHKTADIKLFESGKTYHQKAGADFPYGEQKQLALVLSGKKHAANHYQPKPEDLNFYSLKAYVEAIFHKLGLHYKAQVSEHPFLNGVYRYQIKNKVIAQIGSVSKSILKNFDIAQPVFYAELFLEEIYPGASKPVIYKEAIKFPAVRRDLALLLDKEISYASIEKLAFETERNFLKEVSLFDVYEGDKIPAGKKSYALSFTLQNEEATLSEQQIINTTQKLMKVFEEKLNARIRV